MLSITDIFSPKWKGILTVVRFEHRRTLGLANEHKRPFFRYCQRDGSCCPSSALATTQKPHENTQKLRPNTQKLPYYSKAYNYLYTLELARLGNLATETEVPKSLCSHIFGPYYKNLTEGHFFRCRLVRFSSSTQPISL